jgi:hypothetical protein
MGAAAVVVVVVVDAVVDRVEGSGGRGARPGGLLMPPTVACVGALPLAAGTGGDSTR